MNIKTIAVIFFSLVVFTAFSSNEVPEARMQQVYDEVCTPEKYGLVLAPEDNNHKMDCPTVFRQGKNWYMTYLVYNGKEGTDGRGYETWLAESPDLLHWKTLGRILFFKDSGWDKNQRGGYISLIDNKWGGSYKVKKHDGKYWITYIGGDTPGYELGVLKVGAAYTDGNIAEAHEWKTFDKPLMTPTDSDAGWWEGLTQYKSSVMFDKSKKLGKPYVMFYNAGGINPESKIKGERIGIALSDDMVNWKRYKGNPVINHEGGITGDAVIQKMDDLYVLFYFSAFRPGVSHKAFNTFCCSYDLINWTDWKGEKLIYPSESFDDQFAHKSCVIKHNGVVYHYYCAVNKDNQRGIALATSKPLGRSSVRFPEPDKVGFRKEISLNGEWESCLEDSVWMKVNVPHNWDQYYGMRRLKHGNLHGSAWYKKYFDAPSDLNGKRCFLYFEGVGSYAAVYVNGKNVGSHKGGRTTFTLDITDALKSGKNLLEVKAEHPAMISDLPWVCGGCSGEAGFSEGSQPLGIFRPVTLVVTDELRVQPFGVHIWNEKGSIRNDGADVNVETTLKNYGNRSRKFELVSRLVDEDGVQAGRIIDSLEIIAGQEISFKQLLKVTRTPKLWSPDKPQLYTMITLIRENGKVIDELRTKYGFRTISWPINRNDGDRRFIINGQPVLINGVCEYEHLNGLSHSFSDQQIKARIDQVRAAGFNAFRDAHQPHNLLYKDLTDKKGLLLWTQFSAHIWFDTPAFRENFKTLLREWVIERRNSPSVILWGLQNESSLPYDFAKECTELIRELDPTTSSQRLVTTCNNGDGTDWNVVQNWSGTYNNGNPDDYGKELIQDLLNGEYGAWRSIDLHTEGGFVQKGIFSEDRMNHLLEQKIRLAEQNKDSLCGQFLWILNSHENPGRIQNEEGFREIDRVGPFNYKGLFTSWGEPLDAFYMYRANYAPKATQPMVYIVSHTWPDRWLKPGNKDSIIVFSNCDSVELFNDYGRQSLGFRVNKGKGYHMQWDNVPVRYNLLYAEGYVDGKKTAYDCIVLNHLPEAPGFAQLYKKPFMKEHLSMKPVSIKGANGYKYIYRVNCGGPDYKDSYGQEWMADRSLSDSAQWGSVSWSDDFKGYNPYLASQRKTNDPVYGTNDWKLFQTFRYGADKLKYVFPVEPGEYLVELYFTEPWYGAGGGMDCDGWRTFDIAVNNHVYIKDLDIWRESGHDGALKKTIKVTVTGNKLELSFPIVKSGQAIISAIAIASTEATGLPEKSQESNIKSWLDTGVKMNPYFTVAYLPPVLYGAQWADLSSLKKDEDFLFETKSDVVAYLGMKSENNIPEGFTVAKLKIGNNNGEYYNLYSKKIEKGKSLKMKPDKSDLIMFVPYAGEIKETVTRPDQRFEAEYAMVTGNFLKGVSYLEKACVYADKPGMSSIKWDVAPGIAGIYNIRFRYRNTTDKTKKMTIKIFSENGREVRRSEIEFPPASEKWRVLGTTTEAWINAGKYSISLESDDATGLWFDCLDFQ
jgi:hypothetical protein